MTAFEQLDQLSTRELHHRAVSTAEHRHDLKFFYQLVEYFPMAEVVASADRDEEQAAHQIAGKLRELVPGGGRLDEALRPIYIDYLERCAAN
jgi:hypothetical protein